MVRKIKHCKIFSRVYVSCARRDGAAFKDLAGVLYPGFFFSCNSHATVQVAMTGRGSFLEIPLDPTQAKDNRNGLVKHIYGQVVHCSHVLYLKYEGVLTSAVILPGDDPRNILLRIHVSRMALTPR